MKTIAINLILILACTPANGQILRMTFTAKGDANRIDWIKATNLTSQVSVTIPGRETLKLVCSTGDPGALGTGGILTEKSTGMVYPNPFRGNATVQFQVKTPQAATVSVRNLAGQIVARTNALVEAGENRFNLILADQGVHIITLHTAEGAYSVEAVSSGAGAGVNSISLDGSYGVRSDGNGAAIKSGESEYTLLMNQGDRILYRCISGPHTTLVTDAPRESRHYVVRFTACTDKQGRNYPVTDINGQTWMTENLAYLPEVCPSYVGCPTTPLYYVYGYEGDDAESARQTQSYREYGALYNWEGARAACPKGWKIPSDADWKKLEKYLGMSGANADESGLRLTGGVGGKLKEQGYEHWHPGMSPASDEVSFSALPGGIRIQPVPENGDSDQSPGNSTICSYGAFASQGSCCAFWTSTAFNSKKAWNRRFGCEDGGVNRFYLHKNLGLSVRCIADKPED